MNIIIGSEQSIQQIGLALYLFIGFLIVWVIGCLINNYKNKK